MKNTGKKEKKIKLNEISIVKDDKRKYSSPKKSTKNLKGIKEEQNKKFSKTIKKGEKYQNKKQIILLQQKDNNKNENPIIIHTSQNFTPNKRKYIQFRLSETQSKKKGNFFYDINENENRNKYLTKEKGLIFKSNLKPKTSNNINTLILNFKKDIPLYGKQNRIRSINSKRNHNNENNSYIINQKRSLLKRSNINTIGTKRNDINKKNNINCDNYTIKISKNKNYSPKKKIKDNFENAIDKEYYKSYIINKYSISFVNDPSKLNEEFQQSSKIICENRNKNNEQNINSLKCTNNTMKKKSINKNLKNSKVKSSVNIKDNNNKSNVIKKKSLSSLSTNNKNIKSKKLIKFLDKNNIHQMTEFSESFNNNSFPIIINKIKFNLDKKFKKSIDRDPIFRENEDDNIHILKKIKKNLNLKKPSTDKKNKTIKNNKNIKKNFPYSKINSQNILITNININLYKDLDTSDKNENIEDNNCINSDENRNTNLKLNFEESKIDLEKIYLLGQKIHRILEKINSYQECKEESQDFITFYFSINFYKKELELFQNNKNKKKLSNYMKLEIMCYFLCYDISFNENFNQASILLKTIIKLLYDNYLILMSYILYLNKKNIFDDNENSSVSLWLNKIEKIIANEVKINLTSQDMNENSILSIIVNSTKTIMNYYKMIIDNLYFINHDENNSIDNPNNNLKFTFPYCLKLDLKLLDNDEKTKIISFFFSNSFKSLNNNFSFENMKIFFYLYLNKSKFNSKVNSLNKISHFLNKNCSKDYLPPIKSNYKYTLLINLDETLIYNDKGKIVLRPNLYNFLEMIKDLYELIIFSFETNLFIDNAIEIIEQKNKYFDYILYANEFTLNIHGRLVKDLEALGRNVKNIIVIDSKSHIEKRFKNNMIIIKGFYGNDLIDINLLKILGYILQNIKNDNYEDDIRLYIGKYKSTIKTYLMNKA